MLLSTTSQKIPKLNFEANLMPVECNAANIYLPL